MVLKWLQYPLLQSFEGMANSSDRTDSMMER